jgi:hypothetical protein
MMKRMSEHIKLFTSLNCPSHNTLSLYVVSSSMGNGHTLRSERLTSPCFFFFLMPFPFFAIRLLRYLFGRRFFLFPIPFCLSSPSFRWCDGAPGHFPRPPTPIPPHIHRHTQHLYTHGRLFPTGLEPVLTSRWWPKEC